MSMTAEPALAEAQPTQLMMKRMARLRHAYRLLLVSKLNTTRALAQIEQDPDLACEEVQYLVDFIRNSKRGVVLRRGTRRLEELVED